MEPIRVPDDVKLIRWPAEAHRREHCRSQGVPRLLVVEGGAEPPVAADVREDWVRTPLPRRDVDARVAAVRARCDAERRPHIDMNGVLHFDARSVTVSPTATDLLCCLIQQFGELVSRRELQKCLPGRERDSSRNALDLQVMRLRKRVKEVGLTITTVWGRGYLLDRTGGTAQ